MRVLGVGEDLDIQANKSICNTEIFSKSIISDPCRRVLRPISNILNPSKP